MEQKDGINKLTNDKKNLSKLFFDYLMYFEIKSNQPFLWQEKDSYQLHFEIKIMLLWQNRDF